MSVDKATIVINGRPLWQRQLGILRDLRPEFLWVSAALVPTWCPSDIPVVTDQIPSCGPLSGVAAGLLRLQTSHLLVLAIDLPTMRTDHLLKLYHLAGPGWGVIPCNGDHLEPLCAIYPAGVGSLAEGLLRDSKPSVQNFGRILKFSCKVNFYELAPEEMHMYLNMNTPEDIPAD